MQKRRILLAALVLATTALGAACDGDDDDNGGEVPAAPTDGTGVPVPPVSGAVPPEGAQPNPPPDDSPMPGPAPAADQSMVRVVHASPDAPAVDIYAAGNATPLFTNVGYTQTTGYQSVAPGTYRLEIRAAGQPASAAPAFTTPPITLTGGEKATAIAAGLLTTTEASQAFRVLVQPETFSEAAANSARAVIVHASPDGPTVGIDVGNDGSAEVPSLSRFTATAATGVDLPAGQPLQVGVFSGSPATPVASFTTPSLTAGSQLYLIAIGSIFQPPRTPTGFSLLAVGPQGTIARIAANPTVRVFNAVADGAPVDVFAGTQQLADAAVFGTLSGPVSFPPGTVTLDVFAPTGGAQRPGGAPAGSSGALTLEAGQQYLAVAAGFLGPGTPSLQILTFAEGFNLTTPDSPLVRFIHAVADVPAVDVGTFSGSTFTPIAGLINIPFGSASASEGVALSEGTTTLAIAPTGTATPAFLGPASLGGGQRVFLVAAGAVSRQPLQLFLIDTTTPFTWQVNQVAGEAPPVAAQPTPPAPAEPTAPAAPTEPTTPTGPTDLPEPTVPSMPTDGDTTPPATPTTGGTDAPTGDAGTAAPPSPTDAGSAGPTSPTTAGTAPIAPTGTAVLAPIALPFGAQIAPIATPGPSASGR